MILKLCPVPDIVVTDLDKTLYKPDAAYLTACERAFKKANRFAVAERFNGTYELAKDYVAQHGVHGSDMPRGTTSLVTHARRALNTDFMQPNTALAQHITHIHRPFYVVSNSKPAWIDDAVYALALHQAIPLQHRLSAPMHLGGRKSHIQTFNNLGAKLQLRDRARILVLDDETDNLNAAHAAGFSTCLIGAFNERELFNLRGARHLNMVMPDVKSALAHFFPLPAPQPHSKPTL